MEEIRICEKCGKEFSVRRPSSKQRFCSYKCSAEWKWENVREREKYVVKSCAHCGKEISIPSSDHRLREGQTIFFCDRECHSRYLKKNKVYHKCIVCGNDITKGKSKRFCSQNCRNTHRSYLAYRRIYNRTIDLTGFLHILRVGNPFTYVGREAIYLKDYNVTNRQRINRQRREREANNDILKYANRIKKNIQQAYRRESELKAPTRIILGCSMQEFIKFALQKLSGQLGMTVQEEKERLLAESLQRAEEELFQDGKETLTKREVLAILEGTYSSLLDKEYEKYRQGSFICASGNFDRYVQYCKDTSGTLAIEYAKVIHAIASKSVEEDKALLNRAKQGLRQAKKELQELKEGIEDTKIVS